VAEGVAPFAVKFAAEDGTALNGALANLIAGSTNMPRRWRSVEMPALRSGLGADNACHRLIL
jgi:hypothetical protein